MLGVRIKIERTPEPIWRDLPRFGRKFLIAGVFLSLLLHVISFLSAGGFGNWNNTRDTAVLEPVKIKINTPKDKSVKDELKGKKIVETPLIETKPPKDADYVGPQDHATQKETKLARKQIVEDRGLDAGKVGKKEAQETAKSLPTPNQIMSGPGTLAIPGLKNEPRTNYERLLPSKENDVFGSPTAGHTEYIDSSIPEGDRLDMNTTSFKYISYFTGMRKAIELVWIYPRPALERGLQGEVMLELVIEKDGKVSKIRIVSSSGYGVLDDNMVKTIKDASPFAPLPKSWKKERILVTGSFHYILSYGAH